MLRRLAVLLFLGLTACTACADARDPATPGDGQEFAAQLQRAMLREALPNDPHAQVLETRCRGIATAKMLKGGSPGTGLLRLYICDAWG